MFLVVPLTGRLTLLRGLALILLHHLLRLIERVHRIVRILRDHLDVRGLPNDIMQLLCLKEALVFDGLCESSIGRLDLLLMMMLVHAQIILCQWRYF